MVFRKTARADVGPHSRESVEPGNSSASSNITATPPICIYPTPINSESLDSGGPIVLNNKNFEENFC